MFRMISSYGWQKKTDTTRALQARDTLARVRGSRKMNVVAVALFCGVCLTALNVYGLRRMQDDHTSRQSSLGDGKRLRGTKNGPTEYIREKRDEFADLRDSAEAVRQKSDPRDDGKHGVLQHRKQVSVKTNENALSMDGPLETHREGIRANKELVLVSKQAHLPLDRDDQGVPERYLAKHDKDEVEQNLITQTPTLQADLRHPPSEHVRILNLPAQQLHMKNNGAPAANWNDQHVQHFVPQFAHRTLQMHEVQRQQVQQQQLQKQLVQKQQVQRRQAQKAQGPVQTSASPDRSPVVWVHAGDILEDGYLDHVLAVFKRIGYRRGGLDSDWDVIWSHFDPFADSTMTPHLSTMKPHQKINHWPGGGLVANKMNLATSGIHFVPKAFGLPHQRKDLLRHSKTNPKKMWVQKNNNHGGIKIRPLNQLDLTGESFVQEYVENPFLIDGRKFDIGIYTVVTSINPLRMYMYEEEALFRYCPKDYYPFDSNDVDKYVVGADYTPTWEMPSLKDTYNRLQYSHKDTWNHYIRSIGKDPSGVWRDIKASLREVYLSKEPRFVEHLSKYTSVRNFFEMVRFDFVVDDDLNIFLMEVNMSPNLSSDHTPPNKFMYEQVVFNLLSLVGVARAIPTTLEKSPEDQNIMMVSERDIQVYPDICTSDTCQSTTSCTNMFCRLCAHCLTADWREHLKAAFMEHVSRRNFRRVCPVPLAQDEAAHTKVQSESDLSEPNWLMDYWYRGKCLQDPAWCT